MQPGVDLLPISDPLTALVLIDEQKVLPSSELILSSFTERNEEIDLLRYSNAVEHGWTTLEPDEAIAEHAREEAFRESLILEVIDELIQGGYTEGSLSANLRDAIQSMESLQHLIRRSKRVTLCGPSADLYTLHAFLNFVAKEQVTFLNSSTVVYGVLPGGRMYASEVHFEAHVESAGSRVRGRFNASRDFNPNTMHETVSATHAAYVQDGGKLVESPGQDATILVELNDDTTYRVFHSGSEDVFVKAFQEDAAEWYTVNLKDVKP